MILLCLTDKLIFGDLFNTGDKFNCACVADLY